MCFGDENIGPPMTEGTHGVGPTGDRWDGKCILDVWYRLYKWMDTQLWDPGASLGMNNEPETVKFGTVERLIHEPADKLLIEGNPNCGRPGDTTGWVGRNRQYEVDVYWLDSHPNRRGGSVMIVVGATMMQCDGYIKGIPTEDWGLSNRSAVGNDVPELSPVHVVCANDTGITWIVLWIGQLLKWPTDWSVMSSGSFLKSVSTSTLDKLYDLPESIQDVMGLQAVRPSAAVCKVMTVPDCNCVRIVTPDEHVPTGFHEILIYDMGQEEWPKVPISEIGCLRLDWPKELFSFVGRYQMELEQMRKECRDQYSNVTSGTCSTCEKFFQVNLGKHVALYHLDLAQLWRCPVGWCPVWKGTSQDCVDHMRRAHDTGLSVKAGNLARWFPPWTVTREQWHSMSRPSVSGIAIDTFLFSRIGTPLFHRYRVFDWFGSHNAFRKPYMQKLFTFLEEADSESIRRSHRRRAKEIAADMSR